MEYVINLNWDVESAVWVATSEDIKGLVLESGSIDALIERARFAVPELLTLNGVSIKDEIYLLFRSERHEKVYA